MICKDEIKKRLVDAETCPKCQGNQTKVVDSRIAIKYERRIRRRECLECSYRWSVVEVMFDQVKKYL